MSKNRTGLHLLFLAAVALVASACGSEWKAVSKKGNTWEYKEGSSVKLTAVVKEKYKIGEREYAEIVFKGSPSYTSVILSWDKDKKTFLQAGRGSYLGDGKPVFFVKETALAKVENKKNDKIKGEDGTEITYLGEDKIKTGKTTVTAHKFSRTGKNKISGEPVNQLFWYVSKKGIVQFKEGSNTLTIAKFTEGKGGDPVSPAGKDDAGKLAALARTFHKDALAGGLTKVKPLFSKLDDNTSAAVKMLIERMKIGTRPEKVGISFPGKGAVCLRFRYQDNASGTPELMQGKAVLNTVKAGDKLVIKSITTKYDKLIK